SFSRMNFQQKVCRISICQPETSFNKLHTSRDVTHGSPSFSEYAIGTARRYRLWGRELDEGRVPEGIHAMLEELGAVKQEK
ncbi:hypothetical protein L9F63_027949, partial [Diploptera punctata]